MNEVHMAMAEGLLEWANLPNFLTPSQEGETKMETKMETNVVEMKTKRSLKDRIRVKYNTWRNNRVIKKGMKEALKEEGGDQMFEKAKAGLKRAASTVWSTTKKVAYAAYKVVRLAAKTALMVLVLWAFWCVVNDVFIPVAAICAIIYVTIHAVDMTAAFVSNWYNRSDIRLVA